MRSLLILGLMAALVGAAGCGKDDAAAGNPACDFRAATVGAIGTCNEFSGTVYDAAVQATSLKEECEQTAGAVFIASDGCPATGRVGRCNVPALGGAGTETVQHYYAGSAMSTYSQVEAACAIIGGTPVAN